MNPLGLVIAGVGAFTILIAVMDWDLFMEHQSGRMWIKLLGRGGARILYGVIGIVMIVAGALIAGGIVAGPG